MAAAQTGSSTISERLVARHIYFQYNATSGCIVDNAIELHDLGKVSVAVGILFTAAVVMQTKTAFTGSHGHGSGLVAHQSET